MQKNITCAVLAGGKATRFDGSNKALIKVGNNTNLDKMIELSESLFSEIILITNNPEQYVNYEKIPIYKDIYTDIGPLAGIHSALTHAKSPNVFLFACDMPFINPELVLAEINTFEQRQCDILIPRIDDFFEPLHSIYRRSVLKQLEEHIKGMDNFSIRAFFNKVKSFYWDLEDSEEMRRAFSNINTHHDYKKALELHVRQPNQR